MKRTVLVLLVLAVILGMVAGCGKGEEGTTTTAVSTVTTGGETPTTGGETPTTVAAAYVPDVVNVGIDGDPTDLDPFTAVQQKNGTTHPLFEQTLGYLNKDGSFSGMLMESYKVVDSKTIEVTLFSGIVDQAGNPFTAADAVWGLNKHVENHSQFAAAVASAEKKDDLNFTIKLSRDAYASDLTDIFTNLYLVTQKAWEASPDHMVVDPVTTAPYKVTKYTSGAELTVEKCDTYWKTDVSKMTPTELTNVQTVNFKVIMDANQMAIALQSGEIDFAQNILLDNVATVTASGKSKVDIFPEFMQHILYPNSDPASPCSDPKVRQAIFYALDSAAITKKMFGDTAVVNNALAAPTYPDYNQAWATADYFKYDVAKAKSLLAEAGYSETNKLKLRLLVLEQPFFKALMTLVTGYLNDTGVIDAQLTALNGPAYFPESGDATKWDLQHFPTFSSDFMASVFRNLTPDWGPGGPINFVKDDQLQTLIATARSLTTHSNDATNAAQDYVNQNAYAYGISANYINAVYPSWCTDFVIGDHMWILPNACTYTQK
jgi:ABC-type transport system substrate-binding protein